MVMNWNSIVGDQFLVKLFIIPTVLGFLFISNHIINLYCKIQNKCLIFVVYSSTLFIWMAVLKLLFNQVDPSFKQDFLSGDASLILVALILSYLLNTSFNYTEYSLIPTLVASLLLHTFLYGFTLGKFLLDFIALCLFWFIVKTIYQNKRYISNHALITIPIVALFLNVSIVLIDYTIIDFNHGTFIVEQTKFTLLHYFFFMYLKVLALLFLAKFVFVAVNIILSEYNLMKKNIYIDELTQVYNRRKFEEVLRELIESDYISNFSLALFDIDSFKFINDTYGHNSGDYVLKNLCIIIKDILKEEHSNGQLFRYGGDEFFLIFRNIEKDSAQKVMKKISREVSLQYFEYRGHQFKITLSSGVLDIKEKVNYSDVLHTIDDKLYEAKHRGKNQVYY